MPFRVNDIDEFRKFCKSFVDQIGIEVHESKDPLVTALGERFGDKSKIVSLQFDAGVPSLREDENGEEYDSDFIAELPKFLAPGSVAVFIGNSTETRRGYITHLGGWACAINAKGKSKDIDLETEILKMAKRLGNIEDTP